MSVIYISNGTIEDISTERGTTYVTAAYMENQNNRGTEQRVRLVIGPRTFVLNADGSSISASALRVGMNINAAFSSAMTRSNPPQANAYLIEIARNSMQDIITVGRILNVDPNNRSFTTVSDGDFSTVIRFNVSENTLILDRFGRAMNFSRLTPGMRVRVRHANFMTASIPPQTTAFEVRVV